MLGCLCAFKFYRNMWMVCTFGKFNAFQVELPRPVLCFVCNFYWVVYIVSLVIVCGIQNIYFCSTVKQNLCIVIFTPLCVYYILLNLFHDLIVEIKLNIYVMQITLCQWSDFMKRLDYLPKIQCVAWLILTTNNDLAQQSSKYNSTLLISK